MPIEFPPKENVRFIKNILIPMSDGVHLAMDIHVPNTEDWQNTPHPLILEYIPYRKDDVPPYSGQHNQFAKNGFIGARLDCRGSGSRDSINTDEYTAREQQDCVEAIAWIAEQPWCTGKIAMTGASYGGFTCVQVAAHHPPNLTTIIPIYFTDDRYTDDCHYRGGCWRCYYDIGAYGASMIGMNAMPPYPEYSGDQWGSVWEQHLEHNVPYLLTWLAHQTDGTYWRPGSIRGRYDQITCPVFMIGGWRDGYPNPPLRTFQNLSVPKRVLVGPWNHSRPDTAVPGPRINHLAEIIRWCNHWLKGEDNGIMDEPPVCIYMQQYDEPHADRLDTTGYWRTEPTFPVPDSSRRTLYLSPDAALNAHAPHTEGEIDTYTYRPTVGLCGGLWSGGVPFGLPTDQRPDEIHGLTYTTETLDVPLEILGQPKVVLHVNSTAPVMAFVARLSDVAPDGTSALVCNGVLNATRRKSLTHPETLEPGHIYELNIDLDCTAWRFEPGHRIRLSICSADFPNLWPTPYPGTNQIHHGESYPSRLILPVIPTRNPVNQVEFAPSPETVEKPYALSPDEPVWQILHDILSDRVGLKTRTHSVSRISDSTEVTNLRELELWASNRNPADVHAIGKHLRKIVRTDSTVTVDAVCNLRTTLTAFHLTVDLNVTYNGIPHHQDRWVRSFPRELL
ncbi:MAG: CocE/NonD family hydrolase [bacterium]|nr:CocE/NonD family hydrolase [bacterium]